MKITTPAGSEETNPIQTQSNPICSELVEPISNDEEEWCAVHTLLAKHKKKKE